MRSKIWLFLLSLAFLLAACSPAATPTKAPTAMAPPAPTQLPTAEALTFEDDLGRTISLERPAQAIVTLGPSILESLFAIGAGDQVVGREEFSTYPDEALEIPNIGSMFGELPAEAILALEPDLVIAPEIISREQVQSLEELGLAVYWQANPLGFEDLYDNLRDLAALAGHEVEAEALINSLTARVTAVEEKLAGVESTPTVFYELDATDPENPFTIGRGTFIDTIITMAAGQNIGAGLTGEYAQMSSEEIIAQDPEVIILGDAPYGVTAERVAARAGWEGLQAVENQAIYPFDPFLVSVPGPRLVDGLEAMALLLHPELFK